MRREERASVVADRSGAIMVLGVFMAVLLVGCLYFVIGVGDAVFYRERVQDAADAGAFSAAIMHARGMNLIALINMLQAALLAVLVALKLLETVVWGTATVLAAMSWFCPPCGATAPPLVEFNTGEVRPAESEASTFIFEAIEALHCAEVGVKWAMPAAAEARVIDTVVGHYDDQVAFGFAWPVFEGLPVEDGTFDQLCKHAATYVGDIGAMPVGWLFGEDSIATKAVSGTIEKAVSIAPAWFCDGGGSGPTVSLDDVVEAHGGQKPEEITPPADAAAEHDCDRECAIDDQACNDAKQDGCRKAQCAQLAAKPDEQGACPGPPPSQANQCPEGYQGSSSDCGCPSEYDDLGYRKDTCERSRRKARSACSTGSFKKYRYQQLGYYVTYHLVQGQVLADELAPYAPDVECDNWESLTDFVEAPELVESGDKPCDSDDYTEWNTRDPDEPVCLEKHAQPLPTTIRLEGEGGEYVQCFAGVSEIINCSNDKDTRVKVPDNPLGDNPGGSSSGGCMQRVPMQPEDGVELGEKRFQLRAFVFGKKPPGRGEAGVEVATWGEGGGGSGGGGGFAGMLESIGSFAGRFQAAQAEYYYDAPDAQDQKGEWLWHMSWRARLRRFRLSMSDSEGSSDPGSACQSGANAQGSDSSSCGGFLQSLSSISDVFIH